MIIDHDKILKHVRKGPRVSGVIHVGAHHAEELPCYRENFGNVPICWIEADPGLEPALREATLSDPNSWYLIQAISDQIALGSFNRSSHEGLSSSLLEFGTHKDVHPSVEYIGQLAVMTVTLDDIDFSREYNFLNMDVQGAEGLVLKGATVLLHQIDYIYAEVNQKELYKGCMLLPEMDDFLTGKGFARRVMKMEQYGWGDAFYVRVTK